MLPRFRIILAILELFYTAIILTCDKKGPFIRPVFDLPCLEHKIQCHTEQARIVVVTKIVPTGAIALIRKLVVFDF